MKFAEGTLVVMEATLLFVLCGARPTCRDDQFWFSITGECEPCSRICDPPGIHEKDCPRFCPKYNPTTTTTTTTTTPSQNTSISQVPGALIAQTGPERTRRDTYSMPWFVMVLIIAGGLAANFVLGCLVYKKRKSLKERWPQRLIFGKVKYQTTTTAQQPGADPNAQERDPEEQNMLPDEADKDNCSVSLRGSGL